MTSQVLSRRMMETPELVRLRFQLVATEFLARMGARIRERREEMGLSRGELARKLPGKVSENQIYRWEKGQHQPQPDTLEALAAVLERDVAYFMTDATRGPTPDLALDGNSQLDRIEARVEQIYSLLTGEVESEVEKAAQILAHGADRLEAAAGLRNSKAPGRSASPRVAARRKRAS